MVDVSIIVPFWKNSHTLGDVTKMIWQNTNLDWELVAVIDGDPFGVFLQREWTGLETMPEHLSIPSRVKLAWNPYPTGITKPCNVGIQMAEGKYISILASDFTVSKYWLEHMKYMLDKHPEYGWILAQSNNTLATMACMARRGLLLSLRGYDETYVRHWEDTDMMNKMLKAGYSPRKCLDVMITHSNEHVRLQDPNDSQYNQDSALHFRTKWGFKAFTDWASVPGEHSGWPGYA